jgi:hypothetical protein
MKSVNQHEMNVETQVNLKSDKTIAIRDLAFWLATAFVALSVLAPMTHALRYFIQHPIYDVMHDIDYAYGYCGLARIHSFADTGRWWTGTWHVDHAPFWRPLTSYVSWFMYLAWPKDDLFHRELVTLAFHLCFLVVATATLWRLTGKRWLVLTTMWLFAGMRFAGMGSTPDPVSRVVIYPKCYHEPLVSMFILLAVLMIVNGRWIAGLACAIISVLFKETGFMAWPVVILALAWEHRSTVFRSDGLRYVTAGITRYWVAISCWGLTFVALALFHYHAVGIGFNMGTPHSWPWRAFCFFSGPVLGILDTPQRGLGVIAIILLAAIVLTRRRSFLVRFFGILAALGLGIGINAWTCGTDWSVSFAMIVESSVFNILSMTIWLLIAWNARMEWPVAAFGMLVSMVLSAPTWMASQVLPHARYASVLFLELVVATALCSAVESAWNWVGSIRKREECEK